MFVLQQELLTCTEASGEGVTLVYTVFFYHKLNTESCRLFHHDATHINKLAVQNIDSAKMCDELGHYWCGKSAFELQRCICGWRYGVSWRTGAGHLQ